MAGQGDTGTLPVLDRYMQQIKEWENFLCVKLTSPMEKVLRDFHDAARLASRRSGNRDVQAVFDQIVANLGNMADNECCREILDNSKEIDICIRMAVRSRAIVMALSTSKQCKEIIRVPTAMEFFRRILTVTASEHPYTTFRSENFNIRKQLRVWIAENITNVLVSLVPVTLFTDEAAPQEEEEKKVAEHPQQVQETKAEEQEYV